MNETIQVTLDSKLAEQLKQTIAQKGVSADSVFADLVQQYLDEAREAKIRVEFERYQVMHAELKEKYLGQYVAVHGGEVVDVDPDVNILIKRVRQRLGQIPVLFTPVEKSPIHEYFIHSTRMVRQE